MNPHSTKAFKIADHRRRQNRTETVVQPAVGCKAVLGKVLTEGLTKCDLVVLHENEAPAAMDKYSGAVPPLAVRCCSVMVQSGHAGPPELVDAGRFRLRRHSVVDAEGIAEAVAVSMTELRPWMPWATDEAAVVDFQRRRLENAVGSWEEGSDFSYVVEDDEDRILGVMSLMARIGPDALEIGYWLRSDFTGRGIATACVAALTKQALALRGVVRVEIHCDEANVRSAAIPQRLGYRLDRIEAGEATAPGEIGRSMIWSFPP